MNRNIPIMKTLLIFLTLAGVTACCFGQPVITSQPRNQAVPAGTTATFSVAAAGTPPLAYQWRSYANDISFTNIPFGTEATLTLTNVQPTSRRFGVVVIDGGGLSVTSSTATLTVALPGPVLVAASSVTGRDVGVLFSKQMSPTGLETPGNYQVQVDGVTVPVSKALAWPGRTSVVLTVSTPITGKFTVVAQQLRDALSTAIETISPVTGHVWGASLVASTVGSPPAGGSFISWEEGRVIQRGIGEGNDSFNYLYQRRTNDFDVQVRVDSVVKEGNSSLTGFDSPYNAVGGLNVRFSLTPFDRAVFLEASPGNGSRLPIWRLWRQNTGGEYDIRWGTSTERFPCWLRLRRAGNSFTFYSSTNGTAWRQIDEPHEMPSVPAVLMIGLASISFRDGIYASGEYRDFGDTRMEQNANAIVSITRAPTAVTVEAGHSTTFDGLASVSGAPDTDLNYQWQAETSPGSGVFTNIFYASSTRLVTPPLTQADSGMRVQLIARVTGGETVVSAPASVTVVPDSTPPHVLSVTPKNGGSELVVTFSEAMNSSALELFSYEGSDFGVSGATIDGSATRVTLTLDTTLDLATSHELTLADLFDVAGQVLDPNPLVKPVTVPVLNIQRGGAQQDLFLGISGVNLSNLRGDPRFPGSPDITSTVTQLEGPINVEENYGTLISGFLVPPVTGNYNFWMASDDQGEFWLSTDQTPANLVLACREPQWHAAREYNSLQRRDPSAPENRSTTLFPTGIPLVAGQRYYFEALSKEGEGDDNLAVAWQIPGGPAPVDGGPPIPGAYLATFIEAGATIEITQQPSDVVSPPGASGTEARPLSVDWFGADHGGFTQQQTGILIGLWTYDPVLELWFTAGIDDVWPSEKLLTSPPMSVTVPGRVQLTFRHRFNFETSDFDYDGGRVRIRVNGGEFVPVPSQSFSTNGYTTIVQGTGPLYHQEGFASKSPNYEGGEFITSIAELGVFAAGDQLEIQFQGSWDWNIAAGSPNWAIKSMDVMEGLPGQKDIEFSVAARASTDEGRPALISYLWQRDCGQGFTDIPGANGATYRFTPAASDAGCQYRCVTFTPGASATSAVATVTADLPPVVISRDGDGVSLQWTLGVLQEAITPNGPWSTVPQAVNPLHLLSPPSNRFYRTIRP